MRPRSPALLLSLALCLALGACAPAATPSTAPLQAIKLCTTSNSSAQLTFWYAFENGLFQKYGLDPELVSIPGGANSVAALLSNDVQMCQMSGAAMADAVAAGEELAIVMGQYDTFMFGLAVSADIQQPSDLIGKTIGVGGAGGLKEVAARAALTALGLEPDTQVTLLPFRDNDEGVMVAAVISGAISGAILSEPVLQTYIDQGVHDLLDISTLGLYYQRQGIGATRAFLTDHRDLALSVLKASIEAIALMKQDEAGAVAVLAQYLKLDVTANAQTLADNYNYVINQRLQPSLFPSGPGMQAVLDTEALSVEAVGELTLDQVIDNSLIQELTDNGFIASVSK